MQISHIIPLPHLQPSTFPTNSSIHMTLTHLVLKHKEYYKFYNYYLLGRGRGYIILDNSLIELGNSVNLKKLMLAAERIVADEIILPDVWKNGIETINFVNKVIDEIESNTDYLNLIYSTEYNNEGDSYLDRENKLIKYQAVCQGKDVEEWKWCFKQLYFNKSIDVIGIPKNTHEIFPGGRPEAVKWVLSNYCIGNQMDAKPIHLLGCWEDIVEEIKQYSSDELSEIRSMDTSIVFHNTIEGNDYSKGETKKPKWTINLENRYDSFSYELFNNNIKFVENLML